MNNYTIRHDFTPIKAQSCTSGFRLERMGRFQNGTPLLVAKEFGTKPERIPWSFTKSQFHI
jgi:hypothetical protein